MNKVINNFKYTYHKYGFLLQQLVSRDFNDGCYGYSFFQCV